MNNRAKTREEKLTEIQDQFSENFSTFVFACEDCKGIDITSMDYWSKEVSGCSNSCNIKLCVQMFAQIFIEDTNTSLSNAIEEDRIGKVNPCKMFC